MWILIIILITPLGTSMTSAEFTSKDKCQEAEHNIAHNLVNFPKINVEAKCYEK